MSGRPSVFKLQLQQNDKKKSVWNRERTSRHLSLWQCLREIFFLRLFISDQTQSELPSQRGAEWNHSPFAHTHAAHASLYTTQPWWTLMSRHPNAAPPPPHRSVKVVLLALFSPEAEISRCSKFFITVSSKLQTPTEHTPDLATR